MPAIGHLHPLVVHFAIALLLVGVAFRLLAFVLKARVAWLGPAAATLLLLGAASAAVSAKSGRDAHGRAEHVPGCADAVFEHEAWGERARNVFLAVAVFEIAALVLARRKKDATIPLLLSTALGLAGAYVILRTGRSGGDLVYAYAGGVGVRGSDAKDTERLLIAGYFHRAEALRDAKKSAEAASLVEEMGARFPSDAEVALVVAESRIVDAKEPARALEKLDAITDADEGVGARRAILRADALDALGKKAEARATLEEAVKKYPTRRSVQRRLDAEKP